MELAKVKGDLLRRRFNEQARLEAAGLKAWREVITPHPDVSNFVQAQVHCRGEGSSECKDPGEFFRRTCITEGLRHLLVGALKRLTPALCGQPSVKKGTAPV